MKDAVVVGIVGLILYLLYKGQEKVTPYDPWVPTEEVTSTITYPGESTG